MSQQSDRLHSSDSEGLGVKLEASFQARLASFKYETPRRARIASQPFSPPSSSTPTEIPQTLSFRKRKRTHTHCSDKEDDVLPALTVTVTRSKKSKKRPKRGYAPPEVYEHLHVLQDYLEPYLDVVFCGINPGCTSAEIGHHYAHPTNHFWRTLHESGLTERLIPACEDYTLPQEYHYGLTNLVDRPSAEQSELSADEIRQGVPFLMNKIAKHRPRILCFLSKGIWEIFLREAYHLSPSSKCATPSPKRTRAQRTSQALPSVTSKYFSPTGGETVEEGSPTSTSSPSQRRLQRPRVPMYDFHWGMQPFKIEHRQIGQTPLEVTTTLFFVVPSPSARVVAYQWWDKIEFFVQLRNFIREVKAGKVDTSTLSTVPLATNKSIYFLIPNA